MPTNSEIPLVDVAVALIRRSGKILVVWNPSWGAFTLPMTKLRSWHDPNVPASGHTEAWLDAAARAAAEYLGRTCEPDALLDDAGEYQQSDRDGAWKRYGFRVFQVQVGDDFTPVAGTVVEWLTPAEIQARRPISPTARHLVAKLQESGKV